MFCAVAGGAPEWGIRVALKLVIFQLPLGSR